MTRLEVRSLTKWYGSARGIEDISFSLAALGDGNGAKDRQFTGFKITRRGHGRSYVDYLPWVNYRFVPGVY